MDNVTHSLAGLLLAEAALRLRARATGSEPSRRVRTVAAVSSVVAANLPDADLFYTGVGGDRLAYMLHHRGYTHTVVAAVAGALLLWGIAWLVARWRATPRPTRGDGRWLLALLVAGTLSHLLLDWTNSYGVHPFWPFDDRWRYGDSVFIAEPWLWVVAVPPLVAVSRARVVRVLLALVLLGGLGLSWRTGAVMNAAAAALTVGALLSVLLTRALRPGARVAGAVVGWVAVTLVMAAGAAVARDEVTRAVHAADPRATLLDVVIAPLPGNPVCSSAIAVERSGSAYRLTSADVSALPALVDAGRCHGRGAIVPPKGIEERTSTRAIRWQTSWSAPAADLVTLARESCVARAALRFIRVPVWADLGDSVALGDKRYGGPLGGFSSLRIPRRSAACPPGVPPWTPPRADLLGG